MDSSGSQSTEVAVQHALHGVGNREFTLRGRVDLIKGMVRLYLDWDGPQVRNIPGTSPLGHFLADYPCTELPTGITNRTTVFSICDLPAADQFRLPSGECHYRAERTADTSSPWPLVLLATIDGGILLKYARPPELSIWQLDDKALEDLLQDKVLFGHVRVELGSLGSNRVQRAEEQLKHERSRDKRLRQAANR